MCRVYKHKRGIFHLQKNKTLSLAEFHKHPARRLWMQKCDTRTAGPLARRLINQLNAFLFKLRQGLVDVFHPEGDVMDALPFFR